MPTDDRRAREWDEYDGKMSDYMISDAALPSGDYRRGLLRKPMAPCGPRPFPKLDAYESPGSIGVAPWHIFGAAPSAWEE